MALAKSKSTGRKKKTKAVSQSALPNAKVREKRKIISDKAVPSANLDLRDDTLRAIEAISKAKTAELSLLYKLLLDAKKPPSARNELVRDLVSYVSKQPANSLLQVFALTEPTKDPTEDYRRWTEIIRKQSHARETERR